MDIRKILQAAIPLIPQKYKARIESGLSQAESMLAGKQVNTFSQAANVMRGAGIDSTHIAKLQGYLNNGMVNTILAATGISKNGIAADLEKLKLTYENLNNNSNTNIGNANSDLDKYRKNLTFLK